MSNSKKNNIKPIEIHSIKNYTRPVKLYDTDKKECIKEFPSINQAAMYLDMHAKSLCYKLENKKKWFHEGIGLNITVR